MEKNDILFGILHLEIKLFSIFLYLIIHENVITLPSCGDVMLYKKT